MAKVRIPTDKMKITSPAKITDPMKTMHPTNITKVTKDMDQVMTTPQATMMKTTTGQTVSMGGPMKSTDSPGHPMAPAAHTETLAVGRRTLTRVRQAMATDIPALCQRITRNITHTRVIERNMEVQTRTITAPVENTRDPKMSIACQKSITKLENTRIVQTMTTKVQVIAMGTMKDLMRIIQVKGTNKLVQAVAIGPLVVTMTV